SPTDPHSVLNPANYTLTGDASGPVTIRSVTYHAAGRTAVLTFDALNSDHYTLRVPTSVQSTDGLGLATPFTTQFAAGGDLSALVQIQFTHARSLRSQQTISYDVTVTNITNRPLLLPLVLELDPVQHYDGVPLGAQGRSDSGAWLIDLSGGLTGGVLGA